MKRPDIAIKCLEIGEIHGHDVSFMREAAAWIKHLESQLQPHKTVDAHDCVLSGNKVFGINEGTQAEGNGVTDDTEAVQAMLNKSQPRKTVRDAVEYYKGVWSLGELNILFWSETYECYGDYSLKAEGAYKVCTREEFETEVGQRKGECQYEDAFGDDCEILIGKEDDIGRIIIRRNNGQYAIVAKSSVKKRKPTISKAEAWDMLVSEDLWPTYIMSEYDVK